MLDVGLGVGVQTLGQSHLLLDYTIIVQGRKFRVHKVVMAAVSDYFRALLCDQFMESEMDETELKGQSADVVEKVLEFVYNGDEDFITQHALDILGCALYLQMPAVIDICIQKLIENLDEKNWHQVLSIFKMYSLEKEAEKVKHYIGDIWESIVDHCKPKEMTFHELEFIVNKWTKSEMDLFLLINTWAYADFKERKEFIDILMCQVRFSLIDLKNLEAIRDMSVFRETSGSWHGLVEKAVEHHQLPIHQKVLDTSEQSKVRTEPLPVFFTTGEVEDQSYFFSLQGKNSWKKQKSLNTPDFSQVEPQDPEDSPLGYSSERFVCPKGIEINNYFVVCTRFNENQEWHIFNPRTLSWSQIASLPRPKTGFSLIYHGSHMYVVGGRFVPDTDTNEIERYSFSDNTWTTFSTLPTSITTKSACVVGDTLYVLGCSSQQAEEEESWTIHERPSILKSLNLSSEGQTWESKSASTRVESTGDMFVMTIDGEDVILVINISFAMHYYRPTQDAWSQFKHSFPVPGDEWADVLVLAGGNSLFYLNIDIEDENADEDDDDDEIGEVCQEWKIPTNGTGGTVVRLADFPLVRDRDSQICINPFGALLALPHTARH